MEYTADNMSFRERKIWRNGYMIAYIYVYGLWILLMIIFLLTGILKL